MPDTLKNNSKNKICWSFLCFLVALCYFLQNTRRRNAIRLSWGDPKHQQNNLYNIKLVFFVGLPQPAANSTGNFCRFV